MVCKCYGYSLELEETVKTQREYFEDQRIEDAEEVFTYEQEMSETDGEKLKATVVDDKPNDDMVNQALRKWLAKQADLTILFID